MQRCRMTSGAALMVVAAVLVACGSSGDGKPKATIASSSSTTTTTAAAAPTASTTAAPQAPKEDAFAAAKRQLQEVADGQFGPEWDEMHPAQQAVVSRDGYINCRATSGPSLQIKSLRQKAVYQETVAIPGTTVRAPSTAVTIEITALVNGQQSMQTATFHEFAVDGRWRWSLPPDTMTECSAKP